MLQSLRLQQSVFPFQEGQSLLKLLLNGGQRYLKLFLRRDVVCRRVDTDLIQLSQDLTRERIQLQDAIHFVTKQLDADDIFIIDRDDLNDISPHSERAALKTDIIAGILNTYQLPQDPVAITEIPVLQRESHRHIVIRRAQTVDARDTGYNQYVPPLEQSTRRRVAQAVNLIVDR